MLRHPGPSSGKLRAAPTFAAEVQITIWQRNSGVTEDRQIPGRPATPPIASHQVDQVYSAFWTYIAPPLTLAKLFLFKRRYERRLVANVGHNVPQEVPDIFAEAVIEICGS